MSSPISLSPTSNMPMNHDLSDVACKSKSDEGEEFTTAIFLFGLRCSIIIVRAIMGNVLILGRFCFIWNYMYLLRTSLFHVVTAQQNDVICNVNAQRVW